jgi:hypothetical protein
MTSVYRLPVAPQASSARLDLLRRRPQRVTSTLPWHLVQRLQERADNEGRSLSNLVAVLLEAATSA